MRRSSHGQQGRAVRPEPFAAVAFAILASGLATAQAPPGYYASLDLSSPAALRASLHAIIDDHTKIPYTASSTDTWNVLELADQDPANPSRILDVYRNRSHAKVGAGNSNYDREHTWPKSYGFPNDAADNYPFSDCHALRLCDVSYNATRSNKPFEDCTASASEYPIEGGSTGSFPGTSNWSTGSFTTGRWQVWRDRRGDVARAQLYLDVRYEGGVHGVTGYAEPNLVLTDNRSLMDSSNTGNNESVGYMGLLSTLLTWHFADPPDAGELRRNDVVFSFQGNRNPFVDRPELAAILWNRPWPGAFLSYGQGCLGSNGGIPVFSAVGTPALGQTFNLRLASAPSSVPAVVNFDVVRQNLPLGGIGFVGCTALALPVFGIASATDAQGALTLPVPIPNSYALLTQSLHGQWLVLDPAGRGAVFSNGGTLTFGKL